jgi:hypothetical protein
MDRYRELHRATKKKTKEKKTRARKVPTKMPTKEKTKVKTVVPLTPQQQALEDASARLEFAKAQVRLAQMEVDLAKTKEVHQFAIPPSSTLSSSTSSSALEGVPCWGSSLLKTASRATSKEEIDLTQMEGESDEFVEDSQAQDQVVDSMSPSLIYQSGDEELDRTCIDSSEWRLLRG